MKLISITASGFKGRDFSFSLKPMNIFFGANYVGKTRVMDAIRLALLGYLPELGKRNQDTFGLATGSAMEVTAVFDDGQTLRRRWSLKGNSVVAENEIPEGVKEWGNLNVMLNADEYFGLTDAARVKYVFAHCQFRGGLDRGGILERLRNVIGKSAAVLDVLDMNILVGLGAQEFVEKLLFEASEAWSAAKVSMLRSEKTIQGLTDMRLRDEPSRPSVLLDEQRAQHTRELAELNQMKGRLMGSYTQMQNDRQRRVVLNREIGFGTKDRLQLVAVSDKYALLTGKLKLEGEITQPQIMAAHAKAGDSSEVVNGLARQITATLRQKFVAEKSLAGLDEATVCPFCGATGDSWKTLKAAEYAAEIDVSAGEVEKLVAAQEQAGVIFRADTIVHGLLIAKQQQLVVLNEEKDRTFREMAALEPRIARLGALDEELARLMPENAELTTQVESAQTRINLSNESIRALDVEIRAVAGRAFELKRLADAEAERDVAKADTAILAAVGKELRVIQGEMVAGAFGPLLIRANSFFSNVLKTELAYNAEEGGEIGVWREGQWIGHRTFSGTEKALTYAAIQAALAMQSPFRMMLVDELGRLDENSRRGVVIAVRQALEDGRIDGFVGIDTGRGELYAAQAKHDPELQVLEIL